MSGIHNKKMKMISLGILGGGQLARMLALSAHNMGIQVWVLSESDRDSAAQVTRHWVQGNPKSLSAVQKFLPKLDFVTFESEFIDIGILDKALKLSKAKVQVLPASKWIQNLQFRSLQKKLLLKYQIPTASYLIVSQSQDLKKLKAPCVFKAEFGGYDGYGTQIVKSKRELTPIKVNFPFLCEDWVDFKRELACVFVRDQFGKLIHFPLVETKQKDGQCVWVRGPVKHKKFAVMKKKIKNMLSDLNYVGAIGFEFFDTGKGLLVNEIAPRVHNSAHYTQNACLHSQFDCHVLAVTGQALPDVNLLVKKFEMKNITSEFSLKEIKHSQFAYTHLYGKDFRPKRKLGHINRLK